MDPVKLVIVAILAAIVVSMGSALFHLVNDRKGETKKMVRSLTVRISLSVALFILLFVAYALGLIEPHGVRP